MIAVQATHQDTDGYDAFVQSINDRFNALTGPVFETDAAGLYETYLAAFTDPEERQYHTCSCCKQFIERFGGLVTVDDNGHLVSAIWNVEDAPDHYERAVADMAHLVQRASITMPFLSSEKMYGTPVTGAWHHFAIKPTKVFQKTGLNNAFQQASLKREEANSVIEALSDYKFETCQEALRVLQSDALPNSAAVLGQIGFLNDLHSQIRFAKGAKNKNNVIYRAVATAPSGFCHPRSSMVATLLDDIVNGKTFEQVKAAWVKKMHPLQYRRPQAAPTAGAIKAAEKAFEELGAASALERRYATMDDVLFKFWEPRGASQAPASGGIFSAVQAKDTPAQRRGLQLPPVVMTLEKFQREVLPTATKIWVVAENGHRNFVQLTTAVHADARPILQWDSAEARNPVAWYLYNGGSTEHSFNLSGTEHEVIAITSKPPQWNAGGFDHQGVGVIFLLKDARDTRQCGGHSALFPSIMKSEFHSFDSTIEAYSKTRALQGWGEQAVAGLLCQKGYDSWAMTLRVMSAGVTSDYRIDRWD